MSIPDGSRQRMQLAIKGNWENDAHIPNGMDRTQIYFADRNRYGGGGEFQHLPDCIYLQTHEIQDAICTLRLTDDTRCQNCTVLHH